MYLWVSFVAVFLLCDYSPTGKRSNESRSIGFIDGSANVDDPTIGEVNKQQSARRHATWNWETTSISDVSFPNQGVIFIDVCTKKRKKKI